jgi:hypothetical protein
VTVWRPLISHTTLKEEKPRRCKEKMAKCSKEVSLLLRKREQRKRLELCRNRAMRPFFGRFSGKRELNRGFMSIYTAV